LSTAGPPQGAKAPLGGSDAHEVPERGGAPAAPRTRVQRRPVHGVLLLDKPLGLSSNQALQKCKWLLRADKAGHTGTLDPLATGVLPLCFGAATKFGQLQLEADKTYEATIRLGVKTSTGDAEGDVIAECPVPAITAAQLAQLTQRFTGPIRQVPPMHSALKKDGKALYEYARAGQEVERDPRNVTVRSLSLAPIDASHLKLVAQVSKGTYIRTLGEDIAEALGCGGHLTFLRRIATGQFRVDQCVTLPALEAMVEDERLGALLPVDALLPDHTAVTLDADNAGRFLSGLRRRGDWPDQEHIAVYGSEPRALLGTAHAKGGELIPSRLLAPTEIQQILQTAS
jgi:tRNA pseudouridine55 synthase